MQLYYARGTISIAAILALYEVGVEFTAIRVDFATGEQTKPPYHAINPKGRVPALVTNRGILTETGAILDYVAAIGPAAALVPADAYLAGKMREVMYYLASTMHVNHAHRMRGSRWASQQASLDDMAAKVTETMTASAANIEKTASLNPYVLGSNISLADLYLYVVCCWLTGDGVDLAAFPRITAFMETMAARASVRTARDNDMI